LEGLCTKYITSLSWQRRTEPRPQVTWRKIVEDRTCSSEDMIAGRQARVHTHTHTHRQTNTLITILRGRSNYPEAKSNRQTVMLALLCRDVRRNARTR